MNNEGSPLKNWRKDFINNLSIPHTLKERCSLKLTSCLAYCSELMVKGPRVRFSRLLLSRIAKSPVMVATLPKELLKWSAIHSEKGLQSCHWGILWILSLGWGLSPYHYALKVKHMPKGCIVWVGTLFHTSSCDERHSGVRCMTNVLQDQSRPYCAISM